MNGAYQPLLKALDLTYPQYLVLMVLWDEGALRVSDLGERLHLDSGTLTPLLKRLEKQGLLERRRSTEDERSVTLHLTSAGTRLRQKALKVPGALFCMTGLSLKGLGELRETLKTLTHHLHSQRKDATP
mgnify:CR=1 FL=1